MHSGSESQPLMRDRVLEEELRISPLSLRFTKRDSVVVARGIACATADRMKTLFPESATEANR